MLQTPCAWVRPEPPAPFIYALVDPLEPGHVRYVGMANRSMLRPFDHARTARTSKKNSYTFNWIRGLQAEDREPAVLILEQLSVGASAELVGFVETAYIASLRSIGHRLTNLHRGGNGSAGGHKLPAEVGAALSARNAGNTYNLGKHHTEEAKQMMSRDRKKLHADHPEIREKMANSRRGKPGKLRGVKRSAAARQAIVEGKKRQWANATPEQRAAHAANVSAGRKGKYLGRKPRLGMKNSAESNAKRSASLRAYHEARKAAGVAVIYPPDRGANISKAKRAANAARKAAQLIDHDDHLS